MEPDKIEPKDFDFKKAQRELIRKELRPILYEHGFVLSRPTTYIRERDGLLQEFYFSVQTGKLRPWVSCRPVFDSRCIVAFGTDSISMKDSMNPYSGFGWCFFDGSYSEDASSPIHVYDSPGRYFEFISGVNSARGKERMELIFSAMTNA